MTIDIERVALLILRTETSRIEMRNVDDGDEPFLYASGNWGPGYVSIKNLVGRKEIIKALMLHLAVKVAEQAPGVDFVAGNVTGGMIPGWGVSENLEALLCKRVPFVYVRDARKKGGQKELITGVVKNPEIKSGMNVLVVEELVNFAQTTCNSALALRGAGYNVTHAATILFYNNPISIKRLKKDEVQMIHLLTLPQLLDVAEQYKIFSNESITQYRAFLKDPILWQKQRGFVPVKSGGTK